jgi:hypothetical protein
MRRGFCISLALFVASACLAQRPDMTPPGYKLIRVSQTPWWNNAPQINDNGQVVFLGWPDSSDRLTEEIFLYDSRTGELTQLTDDYVQDVGPDINDDGVIVWSRGIGPIDPDRNEPSGEIVVRTPDGTITRLTDNAENDFRPRINNIGQIVWFREGPQACGGRLKDLFWYNGLTVERLTYDGWDQDLENQSPEINDLGDIVWTKYDFCDPPDGWYFTSKIFMYSGGQTFELSTPEDTFPQLPDLNNIGTVMWGYRDMMTKVRHVVTWQNGQRTVLPITGQGPVIDDFGRMACVHDAGPVGDWDVWYDFADGWRQMPSTNAVDGTLDMNERGEIAFKAGFFPYSTVLMIKRMSRGDMNCDDSINTLDIEPFCKALVDPDGYAQQWPDCDPALADVNEDGRVDALDIEAFIDVLQS